MAMICGALAAVAIGTAPAAIADDPTDCTNDSDATVCDSPGNSQIQVSPPDIVDTGGYDSVERSA
jgi:hypothetical protein